MTDKLQQLDVRYVPAEDRLMLRLNTRDGQGVRFWLTRRYVGLVWQALSAAVVGDRAVRGQSDAAARQAVIDLQKEAALQNADFSSPYKEEGLTFPLGEKPVLLTALTYRVDEAGRLILGLQAVGHPTVTIALDGRLVHAYRKLLIQATGKAEWNLALQEGVPAGAGEEASTVATRH